MQTLLLTTLLCIISECCLALTDDYLYNINWPGNAKSFANPLQYENIVVRSKDNEVFECKLPSRPLSKDSLEEEMSSRNPPVLQLLKPLFDQTACSYKVDVYWNYEICHGRHARQYHEQKSSGSEAVVTGFYLGYYQQKSKQSNEQPQEEQTELESEEEKRKKPGVVTIDGQQYPYYELQMTAGTQCDLTGNPREIVIWYVCTDEGKGEIHELTEVSSCKYRAIVLTKLLCQHPRYQPKRIHVNQIHCLPRDSTEKKPAALAALEHKQQQQVKDSLPNLEGLLGSDAKVHIVQRGGHVFISVLKKPQGEQQQLEEKQQQQQQPQQPQEQQQKPTDAASLPEMSAKKFLTGAACLIGGSTWWRHQICFRDRIFQFHVFEDGSRQEITLGRWNPESHIKMAGKQHLPVADASKRTELIQFYTDGDKCELTGKGRWTQLVLKCDKKAGAAISITFAEPHTCQYTLIVEGKLLCPIIQAADAATGIVSADAEVETPAAVSGSDEQQKQQPQESVDKTP